MINISKDEKRYSEIELDLHKKLAYEKGRASIVEELEKIKGKIIINDNFEWVFSGRKFIEKKAILDIIDEEISELKGENKE